MAFRPFNDLVDDAKRTITIHTVASASKSVYRKLGVSNRAQLTKRMQLF